MSKKDRSLANSRDEAKKIYYQRKEINRLQQENQQLNQQLKEYKRLGYKHLQEKNNKLESELDEIREYIDNLPFKDLIPIEVKVINKILDKVKE